MRINRFVAGLVVSLFGTALVANEVILSQGGKAKLSTVVSPEADETVRRAAGDLARYLESISIASFKVREGTGATGLVVGVADQLAEVPFKNEFGDGPFQRDHYRLVSP